jgi:UDP-N-acetylmuramate--alanine ligase
VTAFGGNACLGQGPEIVVEADESDASFLHYRPDVEVITNIEKEHLDYFHTLENVVGAYREFIDRMPPEGEWFGYGGDAAVARLAAQGLRKSALYDLKPNGAGMLHATDIDECPQGRRGVSFAAWRGSERLGRVCLQILGRHNVLNALAAIGVGLKLGIAFEPMASALARYAGAARRFDVRYEDADYLVVDDYAHHPTEIEKTLQAAKRLNKKRIVALFQPHRYSRTESLLDEFGKSFADADKLIVTDVYAAGEKPKVGVSGHQVSEVVRK